MFSVYNAGPSTITLKRGNAYFLLWLAELTNKLAQKEAYNTDENHHQNQSGIRTEYIDALKRGDLASPSSLSKRINKLGNRIKINYFVTTFILSVAVATCLYFYRQNSKY